jgi:hypothetical protein
LVERGDKRVELRDKSVELRDKRWEEGKGRKYLYNSKKSSNFAG